MSSAVFTGTKLDSLTLVLPFQEGLINEQHKAWTDGYVVISDRTNKTVETKCRGSYVNKTRSLKVWIGREGKGNNLTVNSWVIKLRIVSHLLGEDYLLGITKSTLSNLVIKINESAGGDLFSFSKQDLIQARYHSADLTRDKILPEGLNIKKAMELIIMMQFHEPFRPPTNESSKQIWKSHEDRSHASFKSPYYTIYGKNSELKKNWPDYLAAVGDLPDLIRVELNIPDRQFFEKVSDYDIQNFGELLEIILVDEVVSKFFKHANSHWFFPLPLELGTVPLGVNGKAIPEVIKVMAENAVLLGDKHGKRPHSFIKPLINKYYMDSDGKDRSKQRRDNSRNLKRWMDYRLNPIQPGATLVATANCETTRNYLHLVNWEILPGESTVPRRAVENGK